MYLLRVFETWDRMPRSGIDRKDRICGFAKVIESDFFCIYIWVEMFGDFWLRYLDLVGSV